MSKRADKLAREVYPLIPHEDLDKHQELIAQQLDRRVAFICGYELAEKDLGWHSVDESLPPIDEEVIVLADRLNLGSLFAIAFGHIVDKEKAVDYNGWNIPGVRYWMPYPEIPNETEI